MNGNSALFLAICLVVIGVILYMCMGCRVECHSRDEFLGEERGTCVNFGVDQSKVKQFQCPSGTKKSGRTLCAEEQCNVTCCYKTCSHQMSTHPEQVKCPAGEVKIVYKYGMPNRHGQLQWPVRCCEKY